MLCFLEDVTKWVDEGSPVDIIYLDFFLKPLTKCHTKDYYLNYGIGNGMINWIEKWLIDRRQRVVVDGEVSNWKAVLSGVPQGSVLGPILFLLYINDLDDDITSKVLKFADDTKVFRKIKSDADRQHLLRSGKCCLILESVSAFTQDMGMKMHNIQWVVLY